LLVPWNPADEGPHEALLREELKGALPRTFRINKSYRNDAIRSPEMFVEELSAAINNVRKQIMNVAEEVRPVAGAEDKPLPTISTAAPSPAGGGK
jgi:hypothetical protein